MGNKRDKCAVWGTISTVVAVAGGTALVVCTGGIALLVGGVALGAGISGTVNTV